MFDYFHTTHGSIGHFFLIHILHSIQLKKTYGNGDDCSSKTNEMKIGVLLLSQLPVPFTKLHLQSQNPLFSSLFFPPIPCTFFLSVPTKQLTLPFPSNLIPKLRENIFLSMSFCHFLILNLKVLFT